MSTSPIFGTKLKNRGYDLIVSFIPVQTKDFSWQLTMNTGITHNSVSNEGYTNTLDDYLNGTAIVDGEPYSTFGHLSLTVWTRKTDVRYSISWIWMRPPTTVIFL